MANPILPRALAWFAASAAAAALIPAPAVAAMPGWSKSDAILGGAPSALQAIIAQQQGVALPNRVPLQPASYSVSVPQAVPAIYYSRPEVSRGVSSGRPDVFGSVALRVSTTRLDARWHRVEHSPVTGAAEHFAEAQTGKDSLERLEAINWYVNRRVRFVDDLKHWGRPDVWSAANETLNSGKGDCEDFAIAKLQMARRAGFQDRDLYLVIVKDLVSRQDHAILVVRAAGRMLVLDNGTDQVLDSDAIRDYRPILTFASKGTWTHGYRVPTTPMNIASAEDSVAKPPIPATDQRSWRASLLAFNTGFSK
jgi:predicted transglutaminase-like cysteine proteinase